MASSVLHHDTSLKDHFQTAGPYIMTSDKTVSFRPVSYSPRAEKQRTAPSTPPGRPRIPLERRSTVHFDDETAPNELPEAATPAETMVSTGTKTGSYGSNRSASRSSVTEPAAPAIANRPVQPSLEVYEIRELTAVDKKWGCLFDIDNQPTERFREAMHSLARYIVSGNGILPCGSSHA